MTKETQMCCHYPKREGNPVCGVKSMKLKMGASLTGRQNYEPRGTTKRNALKSSSRIKLVGPLSFHYFQTTILYVLQNPQSKELDDTITLDH